MNDKPKHFEQVIITDDPATWPSEIPCYIYAPYGPICKTTTPKYFKGYWWLKPIAQSNFNKVFQIAEDLLNNIICADPNVINNKYPQPDTIILGLYHKCKNLNEELKRLKPIDQSE